MRGEGGRDYLSLKRDKFVVVVVVVLSMYEHNLGSIDGHG